ncbi:RDD family protein [Pontibacter sp. HSC-14F20]|uniref:RDD family protein n=1 Tax=Pontibacter sp. HSC-14F20 TaxID=2864136 RepID=UPI001C72B21B|nr:RDD family protein [Pontibacter sp. HSC-14F20]MBX0334482.1 RDD family protein [Pontibacter sp. HSC-14F20]
MPTAITDSAFIMSSASPIVKRAPLYGSFISRFVAFLIDTTILVFWYSIIIYSMAEYSLQFNTWKQVVSEGGISLMEFEAVLQLFFYSLYFPILHWLYYTLLEASPKQATIGKFTLGLKVTDVRGKRISLLQANVRYFSRLLSALPLLLGFLLIQFTRRRQALHDYVARTLVMTDQ